MFSNIDPGVGKRHDPVVQAQRLLPLLQPMSLFPSASGKSPRPDAPLRAVHTHCLHCIAGPDLTSLSQAGNHCAFCLIRPESANSSPAWAAGVMLSNTHLVVSLHYLQLFSSCWKCTHTHATYRFTQTHTYKDIRTNHVPTHTHQHVCTTTHRCTYTHIHQDTPFLEPWKWSPASFTGPAVNCRSFVWFPSLLPPGFPLLSGSHLCKIKEIHVLRVEGRHTWDYQ